MSEYTYTPVADGVYYCQCGSGCDSKLKIGTDDEGDYIAMWSYEGDESALVELHAMRLCRRVPLPQPDPIDKLPDQVRADLTTVLVWCEHYGRQEEHEAAMRLLDYFVPEK